MLILITTTSNIESQRFVRHLRLGTGAASAEAQLVSVVSGIAVVTWNM